MMAVKCFSDGLLVGLLKFVCWDHRSVSDGVGLVNDEIRVWIICLLSLSMSHRIKALR